MALRFSDWEKKKLEFLGKCEMFISMTDNGQQVMMAKEYLSPQML
jgi:hypothetical protein